MDFQLLVSDRISTFRWRYVHAWSFTVKRWYNSWSTVGHTLHVAQHEHSIIQQWLTTLYLVTLHFTSEHLFTFLNQKVNLVLKWREEKKLVLETGTDVIWKLHRNWIYNDYKNNDIENVTEVIPKSETSLSPAMLAQFPPPNFVGSDHKSRRSVVHFIQIFLTVTVKLHARINGS